MSKVPSYRWTCFRCQMANEADTAVCAGCGFSSGVTGEQLRSMIREATPEHDSSRSRDADFMSWFVLLFPEGLAALAMLVYSPVLLHDLFKAGAVLRGLLFLLAIGVSVALLYLAGRERLRWLAYAGVMILLVSGWAVARI